MRRLSHTFVNIAKEPEVVDMVAACVKAFGRLDCAANCAGIARGSTKTTDMPLETFDRLCSVNEKGTWLCQKHELRQMLTQDVPSPSTEGADPSRGTRGSIVNIASMSATTALGELGAYTSSKHGVLGFARVDAREYAGRRIRINCVSPGFVNTPMIQGAGLSEEFLNMTKAQSPMGRMTLAEEVRRCSFLLEERRGLRGAIF